MIQRTRIPRKRSKPRRKRPHLFNRRERNTAFLDPRSYVTKGGRVRLFGEDMLGLRLEVFFRAKGRCEGRNHHPSCTGWVAFDNGHLSHKQHGPNKTDTMEGTEWKSPACHLIKQHNPKPCPKKARSLGPESEVLVTDTKGK